MKLRPISEASTSGPVEHVLVLLKDRYGNKIWVVAHYAFGGGEDQPPFRGWFHWTGHGYSQLDEKTFLGWIPMPEVEL